MRSSTGSLENLSESPVRFAGRMAPRYQILVFPKSSERTSLEAVVPVATVTREPLESFVAEVWVLELVAEAKEDTQRIVQTAMVQMA